MKIALQLYSIKDISEEKGLPAALDKAKELGYDGVEFAGLFGLTPEQAKNELDKRGLGCAGFHDGYELVFNETDAEIEKVKICGACSLCVPYYKAESIDGWVQFGKKMDEVGEKFRRAGILLGYHNHEFEFAAMDGIYPIDAILGNSRPENVFFEMDTRHVAVAGSNPADFAKKYAGRIPVLHARDTDGKDDCAVGSGIVDFEAVVKESGMPEWFVVENENFGKNEQQLADSVTYIRKTFA